MNAEKVLKKLAQEQKPKVGNGGKAFKSLTAAVKAAEAAKEEACKQAADAQWANESASKFAFQCDLIREDFYKKAMETQGYVFKMTVFLAIVFLANMAVTIFCS